jgi:pyruvate-ferredoxin/flavodoxin oxidoreductase
LAESAPPFVRDVLGAIIAGRGDQLPVSALPCDGTFPTGTARYEKRNIATEIPVWDPVTCIQCGKCAMVCPHAVIRIKAYEPTCVETLPPAFKACEAKDRDWHGLKYTIQVAPEDCTGCALCVDICPAKNKSQTRLKAINMMPVAPLREQERKNWNYFLALPELDRRQLRVTSVRAQQVQQPLFEFSGACAGCGETPYVKLISQLFGDRLLVANATGCSSIYGGNLPTTPWTTNAAGRGPAWSNSLFEDNAEFGLGMRVALDKQRELAIELVRRLTESIGDELATALVSARQNDEADIFEQRERVAALRSKLETLETPDAKMLLGLADALVKKSVWIVGGDGWAYDIGFSGLDHVLACGRDVNVLVLDTEVYSNTGGQMSKATPRAAVAKFAAGGKPVRKKDLGLMAMTYGNVYVASVAMGAKDEHTLRAFLEAESYDGPSLIIAYSHCIAHGINMATGMQNQRAAVDAEHWLLYRFDPRRTLENQNPLQLDSHGPKMALEKYLAMENRFKMLTKSRPQEARKLFELAQEDVRARYQMYEHLAAQKPRVEAAT